MQFALKHAGGHYVLHISLFPIGISFALSHDYGLYRVIGVKFLPLVDCFDCVHGIEEVARQETRALDELETFKKFS